VYTSSDWIACLKQIGHFGCVDLNPQADLVVHVWFWVPAPVAAAAAAAATHVLCGARGAGEACVSSQSDYNQDIVSPMSLHASHCAATSHLTPMTRTVKGRNLRGCKEDCLLYGCLYRTTCVQ